MFTEIDKVLFPNKCEVIQTASHEFIYPIFKNGSSSLYETAIENNWKIILNKQICNCDTITVFLREPIERFQTGVNTFLNLCLEKNLDKTTSIYFIENYMFLNRHYMPQILWLLHLARYSKPDVIIDFKNISEINNYTLLKNNKSTYNYKTNINLDKLKFYIEADNYLLSYINEPVTMKNLFLNYEKECKESYNYIFIHAKNLIDALPTN